MEISDIRNRIMDIYVEQEALGKELKEKLEELRTRCVHGSVVEVEYEPETHSKSAEFPARICVICSLERNRTCEGYKELDHGTVLKIKYRNEFYKYRKLQPLKTVEVPIDFKP